VLLLPVKACASGLTLTIANHVILVDLQADHRMELQLVNRVWRIGQERPVHVKRFVSAGTVEERMLEIRKKTSGLLATAGEDAMAVASVGGGTDELNGGGGKGKAPAAGVARASAASEEAQERLAELRYLLGLAAFESA